MKAAHVSRRSLLWGVGFFLLLQAGGGVALDWFCPLWRFPSARDALDALQRQAVAPRMVVLGSSRLGCGFDTAEAHRLLWSATGSTRLRVFNLSVPGGEPTSHELLLGQLLARGARPDWLLVEIAPENLTYPCAWLPMHATRQLGWRHLFTHTVELARVNSVPRYLGALILPLWVHRQRLLDALSRPPRGAVAERPAEVPPPIDWEQVLRVPRLTSREEQRRRLLEGGPAARAWLRNYRVGGQSALALERFLRRCHREGIRVAFVLPPLASPYRAEYRTEIEAAFHDYLTPLRREYGCPLFDGRARVPDELFLDSGHLDNPEGGRYFTRLLARQVLLPLLGERSLTKNDPPSALPAEDAVEGVGRLPD
jgi:hypothetical protein